MLSKRSIAALALLLVTLPVVRATSAEGWETNWEDAKKKAAKEKKDILIDFTGSDWCGWCIKLKDEVFTKELFKKEAPKHYVLLELDFPRRKALSPKLKKQNEELRGKFMIRGYPTIMLTDALGRAYAKTGYQPGGPKSYLDHLKEKREEREARDKSFAKARASKEDVEKAKLLDQALTQLERQGVLVGYDDVMKEIVSLDKENKASLRSKYDERLNLGGIERALNANKIDDAIKLVDAYVKSELAGIESKQKALFLRGRAYFMKKDFKAALASLESAQKQAPDTLLAKRIPQIIQQVKTQIDQ